LFAEKTYFCLHVSMNRYIDVFSIDLQSVSILDLQYICHPMNIDFLLQIFQSEQYLHPFYLLFDGDRVRNGVVIDGVDDSVTVVCDELIEKLWLGSEHYFWLVCALDRQYQETNQQKSLHTDIDILLTLKSKKT